MNHSICPLPATSASPHEPEDEGPATAVLPRGLVLLFATACGICVANVYYAQPLLETLATEFGLTPAAAGVVVTVTQVGSALALLFLVPLGDLLERRRLMLLQLMALGGALILAGEASSRPMLLVSMVMVGLLGTAMTQGLIAYAATAAPIEERGRVVGTVQGGVVMGLLLARVVSGFVADLAGWRFVYLGSAGLSLALLAVLWKVLPKQEVGAQPLSYPRLLGSMVTMLAGDRVLQIRGTLALLMFAVFNIFWSALVLPLAAPPYGFSHTVMGAFGLVGAVGALGASRAGYWTDRGRGQWVSGMALALLLLAWLPLAFSLHSLWALVIGILVLDLGGQALHVANQSMIFQRGTEAHSRLVGCYMAFYAVGSGLGAVSATTMYAHAGWSGVCLLGSGVSLLALGFWWMSRRWMPTG